MTGFEFFQKYQAIKLHFSTNSYDYFKYYGKVATKEAAFENRKDKYMFHKLARTYNDDEVVWFLVANFMKNQKMWTQDLVQSSAKDNYLEWRKKYEALSYMFDQDLEKIVSGIPDKKDIFNIPADGSFPVIWTMMNQGDIMMETISILHALTGFLLSWDKSFSNDYIYNKTSTTIKKYTPFLNIVGNSNYDKFKEIAKKRLTNA
jgi:T4 gene Gp59 loader of gp41 DNA helicase